MHRLLAFTITFLLYPLPQWLKQSTDCIDMVADDSLQSLSQLAQSCSQRAYLMHWSIGLVHIQLGSHRARSHACCRTCTRLRDFSNLMLRHTTNLCLTDTGNYLDATIEQLQCSAAFRTHPRCLLHSVQIVFCMAKLQCLPNLAAGMQFARLYKPKSSD